MKSFIRKAACSFELVRCAADLCGSSDKVGGKKERNQKRRKVRDVKVGNEKA